MRIHIVEHVPFEGPGLILEWAKEKKSPDWVYKTMGRRSISVGELL